jgi:two-component system LytT family response regulator
VSSYTAILIDDEFSALNGLKLKMEKFVPDVEILQTFEKPEEAIKYLENKQPDLLFLDIQMPRMNGFELLARLPNINFQVIFVTAYSEYALNALKKNAVDYVMKPVDTNDLISAVKKAKAIISENKNKETNENLIKLLSKTISQNNKLIVPTSKGMSFIPLEEVLHLEGYEGYTKIHLINDVEILSSYNLGKFEKALSQSFFKCHKSHIVNIGKVRSFENEGYVVLENDYRVPIAKANKKVFLKLFNSPT